MAIQTEVTFVAKATVRVYSLVKDDDDNLVDPTTSIKVTISEEDGDVVVDDQAMSKIDTGTYEYYWNTTTNTTKCKYNGEVVVVDGSGESAKTSVDLFSFEVK